jgi:hypothetical protein
MLAFGGAVTVRLCWPLSAQLHGDYVGLCRRSNYEIILALAAQLQGDYIGL